MDTKTIYKIGLDHVSNIDIRLSDEMNDSTNNNHIYYTIKRYQAMMFIAFQFTLTKFSDLVNKSLYFFDLGNLIKKTIARIIEIAPVKLFDTNIAIPHAS